uniref:Uncharacterized protein n=1 Tax=Cryptomonas curvata TaxID=233186 RepID=A0A7S0QQ39_9CRYP|mmetsp:Transcript_43358/g.90806  ORF Transcript_43358/g.90806 Transcript_43358/m.90806 type:complete len:120 (+) Transcript_43358:269-628(+)
MIPPTACTHFPAALVAHSHALAVTHAGVDTLVQTRTHAVLTRPLLAGTSAGCLFAPPSLSFVQGPCFLLTPFSMSFLSSPTFGPTLPLYPGPTRRAQIQIHDARMHELKLKVCAQLCDH